MLIVCLVIELEANPFLQQLFEFNCYRQWSQIILPEWGRTADFSYLDVIRWRPKEAVNSLEGV